MADAVTLMWYCKTPHGWRRFPVLLEKRQGAFEPRHRHGFVIDHGQLVEYPQGRYQLRTHEHSKPVYRTLDTCNPHRAVTALLNARRAAKDSAATGPTVHSLQNARDAYIGRL